MPWTARCTWRVAEIYKREGSKNTGKFTKTHHTGRKMRGMFLASPVFLCESLISREFFHEMGQFWNFLLRVKKLLGFEAWQICLDKDSPNKCRFIWLLRSLRSFDHLTIHMNTAHVTHLWFKKKKLLYPVPKASKKNQPPQPQSPQATPQLHPQQKTKTGVSGCFPHPEVPPILFLPWDRPGFGEEGEAFRDRAEIPRFPLGLRDLGVQKSCGEDPENPCRWGWMCAYPHYLHFKLVFRYICQVVWKRQIFWTHKNSMSDISWLVVDVLWTGHLEKNQKKPVKIVLQGRFCRCNLSSFEGPKWIKMGHLTMDQPLFKTSKSWNF